MSDADAYKAIKKFRHLLTRQQVRTLAGQIKSGQPEAARRGLEKILSRAAAHLTQEETTNG